MTKRFSSADLAASLQKSGLPVEFKYRANPKKSPGPSESEIQQQLIHLWDTGECVAYHLDPDDLMAFPLQAARTPRNGARMKREGMRKGTLDLLLAVPRGDFSGLWIEMKTEKGVVSKEQDRMLARLNRRGYSTAVCRTVDEAILEIRMYLILLAK